MQRDRVKDWTEGEQKDSKEAHRAKKGRMREEGKVGRRMFVTPLHQLQGGWAVLRPWHAVPRRSQLIHEHTSFGLELTSCLTILQQLSAQSNTYFQTKTLWHAHTLSWTNFTHFWGIFVAAKFFYRRTSITYQTMQGFLWHATMHGLDWKITVSKFRSLVRANYPPLGTAVFH